MKLFKNKFVIGALCILLGLLFSFIALPALFDSGQSESVNVLRMKQTVQAGTQITADMMETVSVPENLIENGVSDAAIAVGQYATADLYGGGLSHHAEAH